MYHIVRNLKYNDVSISRKVTVFTKSHLKFKWNESDVNQENEDPNGKSDVDDAYKNILTKLVNPYIGGQYLSESHKKTMNLKRMNIIKAINAVCESCYCNQPGEYCVPPEKVCNSVKEVCKDCCCRKKESCVKHEEIMDHVKKLCVNCCCKDREYGFISKDIVEMAKEYCVCPIKAIRYQAAALQQCVQT
ncbi:hypothetical protein BdWA1_002269 [Babesia duncani]|uniref:Uncharacterized protein n=1 Tax=Babesia duncani TaxID=323732 RepID=A0AAD9PIY6_9APIC|nr:hypothetical protein BdWA1_002269 [Babesia duncani]